MTLAEKAALADAKHNAWKLPDEHEHHEHMDASEKLQRCVQLSRLLIEGGYHCFSKLLQQVFPTSNELYQHLRTPATERELRRIKVLKLLSEEEFQQLYSASEIKLADLFYDQTEASLPTPTQAENLEQFGRKLRWLLLLQKYAGIPANSPDEDFQSEIRVYQDFRKQVTKIVESLSGHSGSMMHTRLSINSSSIKESGELDKKKVSFKQCWQHLVFFYRHIIKLVEDYEPLESGTSDSDSLRSTINHLLKTLKHGEEEQTQVSHHDSTEAIELLTKFRDWTVSEARIEALEEQKRDRKMKGTKDLLILTEPLITKKKNGVTFTDSDSPAGRSMTMANLLPSSWNEIKNGMDFEKRTALAMHYEELTSEVKSDMVIDHLVNKRILSIRESSIIFSTANAQEQMQILLNLLVRKEVDLRGTQRVSIVDDGSTGLGDMGELSSVRDGFDELLDAIQSRYPVLTNKIREEYGRLVADTRALSFVTIDSNMEHARLTLKAYYENALLCNDSPFPLYPNLKVKLSQYYVPMQVAYPVCDRMVNITDMFVNHDPSKANRWIVVEGESGVGKSTFARHMVELWTKHVKPRSESMTSRSKSAESERISPDSPAEKVPFDLLLYIDLRSLQVTQANTSTRLHSLMVDSTNIDPKDKRHDKKNKKKKSLDLQSLEKLDAKTVLIDQLVSAQQFLHALVMDENSKLVSGKNTPREKSTVKPEFDEEDESRSIASYASLVRGKLSFRDFTELIEDNQSRLLVIVDNYEPTQATLPMTFHGEFHQDGGVCSVIDSLLYGTYLPEATVLLLSSPQYISAFKDQYDTRFVLCGFDSNLVLSDRSAPAPVPAATENWKQRKITRELSAANTVTKLDVVNTSKTQFVRNYCNLTNASVENFYFLLKLIDRFCSQSNVGGSKRDEREDTTQYMHRDVVEALSNLVANRRHGRFTPLVLVHTYTRVPLFFTMLLTIVDMTKKVEQSGASKMFNLNQILISLFNACNTNSILYAQTYLIDQFMNAIRFSLSQSGNDEARRLLVNRTFQYLQETAFRQLVQPCGGMTDHVMNRLQKLQQAQATQIMTSQSQQGESPLLFGGVGMSPTATGPTLAEIETLYLATNQNSVRELIALSGLLKLDGSSAGDQLETNPSLIANDPRSLFSSHYVFRHRLILEFLAARYLDVSVNAMLNLQASAPTAATNTDDIRKFFLGLLQNTYWNNVVIFFANMKCFGQNSTPSASPVSAEGSGSLKYFFEALGTLSKYRLFKYAKVEAAQKSPGSSPTGFGFSSLGASPVEANSGRLANLNLQMSLLMMSASPGSEDAPTGVTTIMQQGKKPLNQPAPAQVSKLHVIQLQLFFDCYNIVSLGTNDMPISNAVENTYLRSCVEAFPHHLVIRNTAIFGGIPKRKGKSKEVVVVPPMMGDHGSSNQLNTKFTISGVCLCLESRYSKITTLEVELSRLNKQNNETLFFRLAETIALLNLRAYTDSGPKTGTLPPIGAAARAAASSTQCCLRVLKIYWTNADFLSKFLLICFKRSADYLVGSKKTRPETKKQQEMAALEAPRRFAIEKLKCIYQSLPQIELSSPESETSSKWSRHLRSAFDCLRITKQLNSFSFKACPKPIILSCVIHALPVTDSLHNLDFGGCRLLLQHAADLAQHLQSREIHVHVVKLAGIKFDVLTFNQFLRCLIDNKSITYLSLSRAPQLDKLQMVALNEVLMLNTHLETLSLEEIPFSRQACEMLVQILKLNSGLRVVKLTNNLLDQEGIRQLQNYVQNTVRKIRIEGI